MTKIRNFIRRCLAVAAIMGGASAASAAVVTGNITGPTTIFAGETATFNYTLSVRPNPVYSFGFPRTRDYDSVRSQGLSFDFGNGQSQSSTLQSTEQVSAPFYSYLIGPEHLITFNGSFQATFDTVGTYTAELAGRFNFWNQEYVVVGRRCTWSSSWFGCLRYEDVYGNRNQVVDSADFSFSAPELTVLAAPSAVPLPAGAVLLLSGLAGVAGLKRRKKSA